jgi:hypothetical protein
MRARRTLEVALALAASLSLPPSIARATPPDRRAALVVGLPGAPGLRASDVEARIRCRDDHRDGERCEIAVRFRLSSFRVDGTLVGSPVEASEDDAPDDQLSVDGARALGAFEVAPRQTRSIELRAVRHLRAEGGSAFLIDALSARHVAVARPRRSAALELRLVIPEASHDGSAVAVSIDAPEGWSTYAEAGATRVDGPGAITVPPAEIVRVQLRHDEPEWSLRNGGPVLGLGGTLDGRFLLHIGYELGLGDFLVGGLTIGTDVREQLDLALVIEGALPMLFVLPSLSVGLGLVVRALPDPRAGMRIELGATLAPIGFVAKLDHWPGDGAWDAALFARISV